MQMAEDAMVNGLVPFFSSRYPFPIDTLVHTYTMVRKWERERERWSNHLYRQPHLLPSLVRWRLIVPILLMPNNSTIGIKPILGGASGRRIAFPMVDFDGHRGEGETRAFLRGVYHWRTNQAWDIIKPHVYENPQITYGLEGLWLFHVVGRLWIFRVRRRRQK